VKSTDLTKLKELLGKIADDVNKYGASVEEAIAEGYKEYIPAKVISKMNDKKNELIGNMSEMEQILDSGKSNYSACDLRKMRRT